MSDVAQASTRERGIAQLEAFAKTLDSALRIPFTPIRFGLDAVLGLVPVVGDLLSAFMSFSIVYRGARLGASRTTVAWMIANVVADFVIGAVPVAGDVADIFFAANERNIALLKADLLPPAQTGQQPP